MDSALRPASWQADARRTALPAFVPALALLAVLKAIDPIGYVGGGSDDWQYLEAARCVAAEGWCVPATHWAARLPLVLPMGAVLAGLGDSAAIAGLVPLAYAIVATTLLSLLVARAFGRTAGIVAGLAFVATPAVNLIALQPAIDLVELTWILAGAAAGWRALHAGSARWAVIAGAALTLALLSRASAAAMLPILGLAALSSGRATRALILSAAAGFAAPLLIEAIAHWATAGDPLLGWTLSAHHARIPSSELAAGVDTSRSPILNLEMIRGWRRAMGIELHWTVDPLVNLLASPALNLTLIGAALLAVTVPRQDRGTVMWLAAAGAAHFLILTFVLAVDPKPRMFLPQIAIAAAIIGVAARRRGPLVVAIGALLLTRGLLVASDRVDLRAAEQVIAHWTGEKGDVEIEETSARVLAFLPAVRRLHDAPIAEPSGMVAIAAGTCPGAVAPAWTLAESRPFIAADPLPVAWLRARAILFEPRLVPNACRYARRSGGAASAASRATISSSARIS